MLINMKNAEICGVLPYKDKQFQPSTVEKEWGWEYIIPGDGYTTKIMEIKPGFKCSLHFHRNKSETFTLVQGILNVEYYEPDSTKHIKRLTQPMSSVVLPKCTPHIFCTPKNQEFNTIFIESSTIDDKDDNYRLTKSGYDE